MQHNYYTLLGVAEDATTEQILKAYRDMIKEVHPDKDAGSRASIILTQMLNEAKEVLANPEKRKRYDEQLHPKPVVQTVVKTVVKREVVREPDFAGWGVALLLLGITAALAYSSDNNRN